MSLIVILGSLVAAQVDRMPADGQPPLRALIERLADPDLTEAQRIELAEELWELEEARFAEFESDEAWPVPFSSQVALTLVGLVVLAVLLILNLSSGWQQTKEAGTSRRRLFLVAAALASLEALPMFTLVVLPTRGETLTIHWIIACGATVYSALVGASMMQPPVRLWGTKEKLPRVTDDAFLARLRTIAEKMEVAVPLVRLWPSTQGSQQAMAFAGTLPAPQLVVTDGILHRLEPAECDGVVAHELAHIANGSLWSLTAVVPVSGAVATAAAAILPSSATIAFGFALLVGLRRIVSRRAEFDCDLRAARAIGFREMSSALSKIHAINPIPDGGLLSLLVFSTATHPARDVRLAALYDAAPADDRPEVSPDRARIVRYHAGAVAAACIWFAAIAGPLVLAWTREEVPWLAAPLWLVAAAPTGLLLLALQRDLRRTRARMGKGRMRLVLAAGLAAVIAVVVVFLLDLIEWRADPFDNPIGLDPQLAAVIVCVVGVGSLVVWLAATAGRRKLLHSVAVALQVHDFPRALELCAAKPKVVRRSHLLRYNHSIAEAVCGDRQAAIAALETLWTDKPRFPLTALALGELLLDDDRPERALEVVRSASPCLPGDAIIPLLEARALRRLGRLDEAQAACDRVLAADPGAGIGHAVAAAILLDRGNFADARKRIDQALTLAPGEAYVLIVDAELALRTLPGDQAGAKLARAAAVARTNPLCFLEVEIARLESRLPAAESAEPPLAAERHVPASPPAFR